MTSFVSSRIKLRVFISCGLLILWGCGTDGGPVGLTAEEETRLSLAAVGGKQGINAITSQNGLVVRFLGEIENKEFRAFCPVDVTIIPKDEGGQTIPGTIATAKVYGSTLTVSETGKEIRNCLRKGERGSFETEEITLTEPYGGDFDIKFCLKNGQEVCQRLCIEDSEGPCDETDYNFLIVEEPKVKLKTAVEPANAMIQIGDKKAIRTRIQFANADTGSLAYDIKVQYVVRDQGGKVLDTAMTPTAITTGQPCEGFNVEPLEAASGNDRVCLTETTASEDFTVETVVPFGVQCSGDRCFDYRISHSECALKSVLNPVCAGP